MSTEQADRARLRLCARWLGVFPVASDPTFGALAEAGGYDGYPTWLATANERGNTPDDPRKNDPLDFVLWQASQDGEPSWESPWGLGRPGWHIECSAMAMSHLGNRIDIHGGGADLIFPHHTCEIAQSENASGRQPFVQIWMHCGMVYLGEEKMSKSLGNLVLVRNLLKPIRLTLYGCCCSRTTTASHGSIPTTIWRQSGRPRQHDTPMR